MTVRCGRKSSREGTSGGLFPQRRVAVDRLVLLQLPGERVQGTPVLLQQAGRPVLRRAISSSTARWVCSEHGRPSSSGCPSGAR
ncbi:hypothetical protein [Amycolatopsis sp. NPDC004625]|uniref:hypothetical protein n=1 Tax=Amycolatopsis sp. NPDC004625 TaxID=3154670 RepID=UPI0033A69E99